MVGIYVHVPFCVSKCPYCDFYSLTGRCDADKDTYVRAVLDRMDEFRGLCADTVYFGGGTPSLLGGRRLSMLLDGIRQRFSLNDGAEITMEANPADDLYDTFAAFRAAGGTRVSLGMQANDDRHLQAIGRRHTINHTVRAVQDLKRAGIDNFSLDLMLGTPFQTVDTVTAAVERCAALGASHVSAYLLKIEPDTPFGNYPPSLPDEDATVSLYHTAAETLEQAGFRQYEISNFAKKGRQSRHNLKYWNLDEYVGFGPSAHSFFNEKRQYYPRSLSAFINGEPPVPEEESVIPVNSPEEYAMLRLRLTEGLMEQHLKQKFGMTIPLKWREKAARFPSSLIRCDERGIRLTREGFLVSDALIAEIVL